MNDKPLPEAETAVIMTADYPKCTHAQEVEFIENTNRYFKESKCEQCHHEYRYRHPVFSFDPEPTQ